MTVLVGWYAWCGANAYLRRRVPTYPSHVVSSHDRLHTRSPMVSIRTVQLFGMIVRSVYTGVGVRGDEVLRG